MLTLLQFSGPSNACGRSGEARPKFDHHGCCLLKWCDDNKQVPFSFAVYADKFGKGRLYELFGIADSGFSSVGKEKPPKYCIHACMPCFGHCRLYFVDASLIL